MFHRKIFGMLFLAMVIPIGCQNDKQELLIQTRETPVETVSNLEDNRMITSIIPLLEEVDGELMYDTVRKLAEAPRAAGTDGEKRAVDYIESQFKSLGYETEVQAVPLVDYNVKKSSLLINDEPIYGDIRAFLGSDVSGKATGELIDVGKALKDKVGEEVRGKIALIERGTNDNTDQIVTVMMEGAIGVIMYNDEPLGSFDLFLEDVKAIPGMAITRSQGLELIEQLKNGPVMATVAVSVETIKKYSYNVIATKKPNGANDTGQIVSIGAHHDSVPMGPGANDDASGVSVVLELARIFAKQSIDTELRFITFGAEELGLIGSSTYVEKLDSEEKMKFVSHFQLDMVGASAAGTGQPADGLMMYTLDGERNLVTDLSAASSMKVFPEAIPYGQEGRSDHQPFHEAGIPAALFIHTPLEPDYHQPTDTIDKISKEKLEQVAKIVGSAVNTIVSPDTPAIARKKEIPIAVEYEFVERSL